MALELENSIVSLKHINARKEGSEDDKELAVDLKLEIDIDAAALRKEAAAEHKAATAAAKKAEKSKSKKTTEPEAAPAQKVRPAATWPFPTPQ